MKRRFIPSIVGGSISFILILASCAPAPTTTAPPTIVPTTTAPTAAPATTAPTATVAPSQEKPQYGGKLTLGVRTDILGFDQGYIRAHWPVVKNVVYDELLAGDRAIGPAGSGKSAFTISHFAPEGFFKETGALAESFEIPDNQTLVFKIRKGIHWQNKPPVNGRELDADDIVSTIKYLYLNPQNTASYNILSAPEGKKLLSATATDKSTVVVKVEDLAQVFIEDIGDKMWIYPRESIQTYGNLREWRNALGTGPYMLTDYVSGSSSSLVRNPDYWMKEVVGPGKGDQLPYIDKVQILILPDASTRLAALRTGKIDHLGMEGSAIKSEDVSSLGKTHPNILTKKVPTPPLEFAIRATSTAPIAKPLMDIKVRRALQMAIDREAMARDLFNSDATPRGGPFFADSPSYTTLDQQVEILQKVWGFTPEEAQWVKKMREYRPDEAKKLLAEAGYPTGFKIEVVIQSIHTDLASVVKEYWAKNLNVELTFNVKETSVWTAIAENHTYDAMLFGRYNYLPPGWAEKLNTQGPSDQSLPRKQGNHVEFSDPKFNTWMDNFYVLYNDYPGRSKALQEVDPYVYQFGYWIEVPDGINYKAWQPWLKGYYGEDSYGYRSSGNWIKFVWIDQNLKK